MFGSENRGVVRGKTVIPRMNSWNVLLLESMYTGLSATLRRCSPLYECDSILRIYLYVWLKCYLSGDPLHGSGSRINPIKRYLCYKFIPKPISSLQLVPGG